MSRAAVERWAPWLAGLVLVAGIVSFAATYVGGSSSSAPPHRKAALEHGELGVLYAFLDTAVARKNLGRAWEIVAPELKQGMSLREWKTGTIPVVPYPVAKARVGIHTAASFTDEAQFKVTFFPKAHPGVASASFAAGLRKLGGRWLVSSWQPSSIVGPGAGK